MSRVAAKWLAGLYRPVAGALRPVVARFHKFWDVDDRAINFYTTEEWDAICEKRAADWELRQKENFLGYVQRNVAPRVKVDLLADEPIKVLKPEVSRDDLLNK